MTKGLARIVCIFIRIVFIFIRCDIKESNLMGHSLYAKTDEIHSEQNLFLIFMYYTLQVSWLGPGRVPAVA
jgi:hypothetical protein